MPTFAEFQGPVESLHLKHGGNGILCARTQSSSLHAAHTSCVQESVDMPIVQVGHWVSSRTPTKYAVLFTNPLFGMKREQYDPCIAYKNTVGKYVMFTDLTDGATEALVECALNFDGDRFQAMGWKASHLITTDVLTLDTSKIESSLHWEPVPSGSWIRADGYIFRMKACDEPHAVAIHKTMPTIEYEAGQYVTEFMYGSSSSWTNNQTDVFVPLCKEEEKRIHASCLRPCCQRFLFNGEILQEEKVSTSDNVKLTVEKLIACL
jgi:hypothetical protein